VPQLATNELFFSADGESENFRSENTRQGISAWAMVVCIRNGTCYQYRYKMRTDERMCTLQWCKKYAVNATKQWIFLRPKRQRKLSALFRKVVKTTFDKIAGNM